MYSVFVKGDARVIFSSVLVDGGVGWEVLNIGGDESVALMGAFVDQY